jgi:enoyl-CoA hydratase/carnithine racemase
MLFIDAGVNGPRLTPQQMLHTILDFPYPTIALITGHTFGGACPFALAHDYRVMNSKRGFFCMPPVNLGLHFDGIGSLPRLKLRPTVARKMLLEGHRWTGSEALQDGIVDAIAEPDDMFRVALELANQWAPKAKMGYVFLKDSPPAHANLRDSVYGLLRYELWGEAIRQFQRISYVHGRQTSLPAKAKV